MIQLKVSYSKEQELSALLQKLEHSKVDVVSVKRAEQRGKNKRAYIRIRIEK